MIQRKEEETYVQFADRVIQSLKSKEINYDEMGDLLLGAENNYCEQNLRKASYVLEKVLNNIIADTHDTDLLEERINQLKAERIKTQTVNLERNKIDRVEGRRALFIEQLKDMTQSLPVPVFEPIQRQVLTKQAYVLTISDIHYGAEFTSINNKYSTEICKQRFNTLLEKTIFYVKTKKISTIEVLFLGDAIQGILRLSDIKLNEISIPQSVVEISRIIASFLNELSTYVNINYYHVPNSNHTQIRPIGTKAGELPSEDVEYIIGNYIQDLLKDNNRTSVNLEFDKNYITVPILNLQVMAMHGHTLKSIKNAIKDLSMLHRTFFDYLFLGHFHAGKEMSSGESMIHDIETLVSPSFVGSCPYSDKIMKGSKPACKLYQFDEVDGHIATYKILLGDKV